MTAQRSPSTRCLDSNIIAHPALNVRLQLGSIPDLVLGGHHDFEIFRASSCCCRVTCFARHSRSRNTARTCRLFNDVHRCLRQLPHTQGPDRGCPRHGTRGHGAVREKLRDLTPMRQTSRLTRKPASATGPMHRSSPQSAKANVRMARSSDHQCPSVCIVICRMTTRMPSSPICGRSSRSETKFRLRSIAFRFRQLMAPRGQRSRDRS
jgi:hypothetical protein